MLSLLEVLTERDSDSIGRQIADDFRRRRIEKNITRRQLSDRSGISQSNITRFEQKGLISLKNLIELAISLGYTSEIKRLFSEPKYRTMDELIAINRNSKKKKASGK